jgi:DNA-binding winged helix-turn-helix (wHTH) protein
MMASKSFVFRFSEFEVRERELRLSRAGDLLPVEPKAFRVLVYLLRNPDRLIPKDELLNAVWGDTAVTDNSLTRAIALLRRVLEDDPRSPRYIETVPTVGYRFLHAVNVSEDPGGYVPSRGLVSDQANNLDPGESGSTMRSAVALACLASILLGLAAVFLLRQRIDIVNRIPMEDSPEVLASRAREIAKSFGYTTRPKDTTFGWEYNADYLLFAARQEDWPARRASFAVQRPPVVFFWYRESPVPLTDFYSVSAPERLDRSTLKVGSLEVLLDSEGRLMEYRSQPSEAASDSQPSPQPGWKGIFAEAGLDPARFTAVTPVVTPESAFDMQEAWIGSWDSNSKDSLRVETASYRGKPVLFRIIGPWTSPDRQSGSSLGWFSSATFLWFLVALPVGAGLLAWRNIRRGRSDLRGAFRVAGWSLICMFLGGVAGNHNVMSFAEIPLLFSAFQHALVAGIIFWLLYMAAEPQTRIRSPRVLESWNRVLAGEFRHPLVGQDVLIGLTIGIPTLLITYAVPIPFMERQAPRLLPYSGAYLSLWCWEAVLAVGGALSYMFALNMMIVIFRRRWIAVAVFVLALTLVITWGFIPPFTAALNVALMLLAVASALLRFGLLCTVALMYVLVIVNPFPVTTNPSLWYARPGLFAMASVLVLALFAFYTTVAGKAWWPERFHEV